MRSSDPSGALILGIGAGVYFFYKGFRSFREYKVLADTPRMPIRSLSMGFAHIHGRAESTSLLTSPLSKTPCCFSPGETDQWKPQNRSASWVRAWPAGRGSQLHIAD